MPYQSGIDRRLEMSIGSLEHNGGDDTHNSRSKSKQTQGNADVFIFRPHPRILNRAKKREICINVGVKRNFGEKNLSELKTVPTSPKSDVNSKSTFCSWANIKDPLN
jgi:hypothetical protein